MADTFTEDTRQWGGKTKLEELVSKVQVAKPVYTALPNTAGQGYNSEWTYNPKTTVIEDAGDGDVRIMGWVHPRGTAICRATNKLCHAQAACVHAGCHREKQGQVMKMGVVPPMNGNKHAFTDPEKGPELVKYVRTMQLVELEKQLNTVIDNWGESLGEETLVLMGPGSAVQIKYPLIDRTSRLCSECHEFVHDCTCKPEYVYGWYSEPEWWNEKDPTRQRWTRADKDMFPAVEHFATSYWVSDHLKRLQDGEL